MDVWKCVEANEASTGSPLTSAGVGGGGGKTAALANAVAVFCVPPPNPSFWCWAAGS